MRLRHPIRPTAGAVRRGSATQSGDDYPRLCEMLVATRERCGVTQAELGRRLGRDQVTIAKIESGLRKIDALELLAIIEVLDGDIAGFMQGLRRGLGWSTGRKTSR